MTLHALSLKVFTSFISEFCLISTLDHCLVSELSSSSSAIAHSAPVVLGHGIRADPKLFWGDGMCRWRTDSATNLRRKAFDSCKLFVYIWLPGALPQTPTGAPTLDTAGGPQTPCALPLWAFVHVGFCPDTPVPTLTSEPGYGTGTPL